MEQRVQYISWETQSALGKASLAARLVARFCGADSGSKRRRRHPKQGNQQRGLLRGSHEDGHPDSESPAGVQCRLQGDKCVIVGAGWKCSVVSGAIVRGGRLRTARAKTEYDLAGL